MLRTNIDLLYEKASFPPMDDTKTEIAALREEIHKLNSHRFVRVHNSLIRLLLFQFIRGLAFGLGTVIGATMLVSVVVVMLSKIDFLPIIGDWASEIARQIEADN